MSSRTLESWIVQLGRLGANLEQDSPSLEVFRLLKSQRWIELGNTLGTRHATLIDPQNERALETPEEVRHLWTLPTYHRMVYLHLDFTPARRHSLSASISWNVPWSPPQPFAPISPSQLIDWLTVTEDLEHPAGEV